MIATSQTYLDEGVPAPTRTGSRIVQVMVSTRNHDESVRFYAETFGLSFTAEISSFQFGAYDTDSFFLLTIENWLDEATPSCFGMLVDDVDAVRQRALKAGAHEVQAPEDFAWKPRSSIIDDPSGNRIQLSQG
jgi:predicted enzyme related to lactoylglutathione lyase